MEINAKQAPLRFRRCTVLHPLEILMMFYQRKVDVPFSFEHMPRKHENASNIMTATGSSNLNVKIGTAMSNTVFQLSEGKY